MEPFLGFIVLTGPLFLIVLWVPVCFLLAIWLGRKFIKKSLPLMIMGGIVVFLVALFLPFADEIAGRIYFYNLCVTEAGAKVYQTIELPSKYWDEDGEPLFMNSRGVLDMEMLGGRLEWRRQKTPYVRTIIKIDKEQWILYDKQLQKKIAEKIEFTRYFGWINILSPAPNVAEGCRDVWANQCNTSEFANKEASRERDFILQVIIPSIDNSRGM
jgi:hypothetical protein